VLLTLLKCNFDLLVLLQNNISTFSKDLLVTFILWVCPAFLWDKIIYIWGNGKPKKCSHWTCVPTCKSSCSKRVSILGISKGVLWTW